MNKLKNKNKRKEKTKDKNTLSTLKKRIITALVLLPLALIAIFELPLLGFAAFTALILSIGAWEWGPFIGFSNKRYRALLMLVLFAAMGFLGASAGLFETGLIEVKDELIRACIVASLIWWLVALCLVITYPRSARLWRGLNWLKGIFGLLTLLPAWISINLIREVEYLNDPQKGAWLLLYVFCLIWAADIGAYFAGKAFGKHKLMPNVSPGKTIEGMLGGLVASSTLIFVTLQTPLFATENTFKIVTVSVFVIFSSVLGDLLESMLKRQAGVKDSGKILPGHGGVLDRVDSLTAAMPIFACFYFYIL